MRIGHSTVVATSIKDVLTKADFIWSCVEDQEAVEQTFWEILSTAQHDLRGKLFIESSTIPPDSTNRIAKQVLDAGGEFVAMPGTLNPLRNREGSFPSMKLRKALSK